MTPWVDPRFLTVADVLVSHDDQLGLFGGAEELRDCNALAPAVGTPSATFEGNILQPTSPPSLVRRQHALDDSVPVLSETIPLRKSRTPIVRNPAQ